MKGKKIKHRPFKEAREFARGLGIKSSDEWKEYCKSSECPDDIAATPEKVYRNEGWIDWYDFLGKSKNSFR